MNKEDAIKFLQEDRLKEVKEFAAKLEALTAEYDVTLDVEVSVSPSGTAKRIVILDNKKIV